MLPLWRRAYERLCLSNPVFFSWISHKHRTSCDGYEWVLSLSLYIYIYNVCVCVCFIEGFSWIRPQLWVLSWPGLFGNNWIPYGAWHQAWKFRGDGQQLTAGWDIFTIWDCSNNLVNFLCSRCMGRRVIVAPALVYSQLNKMSSETVKHFGETVKAGGRMLLHHPCREKWWVRWKLL